MFVAGFAEASYMRLEFYGVKPPCAFCFKVLFFVRKPSFLTLTLCFLSRTIINEIGVCVLVNFCSLD